MSISEVNEGINSQWCVGWHSGCKFKFYLIRGRKCVFLPILCYRWRGRNWLGENRGDSTSSGTTSQGPGVLHVLWAAPLTVSRRRLWWHVASGSHSEKGRYLIGKGKQILLHHLFLLDMEKWKGANRPSLYIMLIHSGRGRAEPAWANACLPLCWPHSLRLNDAISGT